MKKGNKAFKFASIAAIPTLILVVILGVACILAINGSYSVAKAGFPGCFKTLFDYSIYNASLHPQRFTGQLLSNLVAYIFGLGAIVMFVLSLVIIKHDKGLKIKAACLSLLLLVPATIGLSGGAINFIGEGLKTVLAMGYKGVVLAFAYALLLALDILYWVLVVIYLANAVPAAAKINKGELPKDYLEEKKEAQAVIAQEDPAVKEADRKALLDDIRKIVREELERLDRVAIVKEEVVVKEVAKAVAAPAPVAAPVEEEDEEKKKSAPRIPFAQKMVKADKEIQDKYNELKNEFLAYGASSRVSIAGDTFRLHRKAYVKITLVGKTMKVYFALNPKDFDESPIPVVDASDKAAYEEVPALLKVKSNLSVKRAKDLAAMAFAKDGAIKEKEAEDHNFIRDLRAELRAKK